MAFVVANVGGPAAVPCTSGQHEYRFMRTFPSRTRKFQVVSAASNKKSSGSSTFRANNPGSKRNPPSTKTGPLESENSSQGTMDSSGWNQTLKLDDIGANSEMPKLPGDEPDFWEGPQWDGLGFFVQYMWAFGALFAVFACGVAVATYNGGATDFKETPAYKESLKSQELFEEPEGSAADVFESNPTEVAPSLE